MNMGAYAVIFTAKLRDPAPGYGATAARMEELAARQPGYLGHCSVRGGDGAGITVSYWESEEAVSAWKAVAEHQAAQQQGRDLFYEWYRLEVCRVERAYGFEAG